MQSASMPRKKVAQAVAALVFALGAQQAFGAAFALQEQSVSGLGNAYAGGAAAAEDASTVWSNPAGMSTLPGIQIVGAVSGIFPSAKFSNNGSIAAFNQPLGGDGGQGGESAALPALYLVVPINRQFAFGLGVGVPFGLETKWDDGWLGRYHALQSKVETMNVNPAVSWRINDQFSVGLGVDYQQVKATFTSNANYSAALAQAAQTAAAGGLIPPAAVGPFIAATGGLDSHVSVTGDDWAWGWNLGFLWNVTPTTRIGGHYRSSIKYNVDGNVNFTNPALPALPPTLAPIGAALAPAVNNVLANGGVTSDIELPSISNLSIYSRLNPNWEVMADVQFTDWSTIQYLTFTRTSGTVLSSTPELFRDAWRASVGASYFMGDKWKFRGGFAFDQSPVRDAERTPRLPDSDRYWLSAGAQYGWSKQLKLDVGLTYIFTSNASSDNNAGSTAQYGLIKGDYDANVFILGGQVTYSF